MKPIKINPNKKYYKRVYLSIPESLIVKFMDKAFPGHNHESFPIKKDELWVWIEWNQSYNKKYEELYIHYMYEIDGKGSGGGNNITKSLWKWLEKNKIIQIV